jgi:hypothetical protein
MVVIKVMYLTSCLRNEYRVAIDFAGIVVMKFMFGSPASFIVALRHNRIDMQSV